MIVLLVDDDESFLSVLSRAARRARFDVVACKSGQDLIAALRDRGEEQALVMLDIHMENTDGIEVIDDLVPAAQHIRLRFMTGGADSYIIAACMIARSRGLTVGRSLFKPFNINTFVDILHEEEMQFSLS